MIDDKKIEKAARQISENVADAKGFDDSKPTHLAFLEGHVDGFNAGAKWAINEFLKDLWRPVSEEPVKDKPFLTQWKDKWLVDVDSSKFPDNNWNRHCEIQGIKRWLYVEDLLPKTKTQEGGEQ